MYASWWCCISHICPLTKSERFYPLQHRCSPVPSPDLVAVSHSASPAARSRWHRPPGTSNLQDTSTKFLGPWDGHWDGLGAICRPNEVCPSASQRLRMRGHHSLPPAAWHRRHSAAPFPLSARAHRRCHGHRPAPTCWSPPQGTGGVAGTGPRSTNTYQYNSVCIYIIIYMCKYRQDNIITLCMWISSFTNSVSYDFLCLYTCAYGHTYVDTVYVLGSPPSLRYFGCYALGGPPTALGRRRGRSRTAGPAGPWSRFWLHVTHIDILMRCIMYNV